MQNASNADDSLLKYLILLLICPGLFHTQKGTWRRVQLRQQPTSSRRRGEETINGFPSRLLVLVMQAQKWREAWATGHNFASFFRLVRDHDLLATIHQDKYLLHSHNDGLLTSSFGAILDNDNPHIHTAPAGALNEYTVCRQEVCQ